MANLTHTLCDEGAVAIADEEFRDETLTFPGTDDYVAGTLLARRKVVTAITPSAVTGTGNGTCTLATVDSGPLVPEVGSYVLTCVTAVAHGGIFKLADPSGRIVATGLAMTASTGATTAFKVAGLAFSLTDGSTDFAAGDFFTLPVVADGTLAVYAPTEKGGAQIPAGLLTYPVSRTGAGTVRVRMLCRGRVNKNRLVIDDATSITNAILDQLRDMGITPIDVQQLSGYDNQ